MFLTIRKKVFIVVICVLLCVSGIGIYFGVKSTVAKPVFAHTIVIDAGHGGVDGGAIGTTTEVTESYLNLQYALTLKEICEQYGFKVVLTRSDMSGLYSPFATNKKRSEMQKRQEIIENSSPDVVVSIHMNSFSTSQARGTQVFYGEGMESGEKLADIVQRQKLEIITF
jgi:N-acetylmuramoyl-L-alanine amidase